MTQEPSQSTPAVVLQTSAQSQRAAPPWLTEAVLLLEVARDSALLTKIRDRVRVPRGRMGTFEACDFFLVLLAYAISGELTMQALYAALAPSVALLGALWSREHLPARSTLSRFLAAVAPAAVQALRQVLFEDLLQHGLSGAQVGGLEDRVGVRHVLFDVDGTRQVARQRQVVGDDQHPPVRRRLDKLCAPGYPGRKRGEVVRTRSTVQQAHTGEWLGTLGAAGNGDAFEELDLAAQAIARYLRERGLCAKQGIVRLDGLYGYVRGAFLLQQQGLGYLMRSADYRLLKDPAVQQVLAQPAQGRFVQPDTGTVREVFEVAALNWVSADGQMRVCCRLLITRRAVDKQRGPRVGKQQGDSALELFVSDREAPGLSALDLLSLYFARGGFEQTLAQEDREQEPDRWCSGHPAGQECWQLLSQWVWNVRLRLGATAAAKVRRTLWAEAQPPTDAVPAAALVAPPPAAVVPQDLAVPPCAAPAPGPLATEALPPTPVRPPPCPAPAPVALAPAAPALAPATQIPAVASPPALAPGQVSFATGRGSRRFAASAFVWTPQQQLRCPAGKLLKLLDRSIVGERRKLRYQAPDADCATCPLARSCRPDVTAKHGRRITVWASDAATPSAVPLAQVLSAPQQPAALSSASPQVCASSSESAPAQTPGSESASTGNLLPPGPPPLGPQAVWWQDMPATALRHILHQGTYCQRVEVSSEPPPLQAPEPLTRARRAHRRLSWAQRMARNAQRARTQPWKVSLFGIPDTIAAYLSNLSPLPC